jgi:hypothetical protein
VTRDKPFRDQPCIAVALPWRLSLSDIGSEAVEEIAERIKFLLAEPASESPVEPPYGGDETLEHRFAFGGELDAVHAPVLRVARSRDEPGGLHAVEVMGQGWALDSHRFGEVSLRAMTLSFERHEDQPRWEGAAGGAEGVVEGSADNLGRAREL